MPTLLGKPALIQAISVDGFIKNGREENIDGIKYDFSLGTDILKAKYKQPINAANFPDTQKKELVIEPGEVVFVLTHETMALPDDIMAILIPKRKLSHDGVMILGGLSIDPLYEGKLLIGLYNFSSSPYPIIPGKKVIGAHFYRLNDTEKESISRPEMKIHDFPDELIRLMQSYKPISTEALLNDVSNLELKVDQLLNELKSRDDWFGKLQDSMDRHEKNIDKILESLEKEVEDRRGSDTALDKKVDGMQVEIKEYMKSAYKTAGVVGGGGALVISGILFALQLYLQREPKNEQKKSDSAIPSITISMDSLRQIMNKPVSDSLSRH